MSAAAAVAAAATARHCMLTPLACPLTGEMNWQLRRSDTPLRYQWISRGREWRPWYVTTELWHLCGRCLAS